jgi:hypothetical protein
MGNDQFRGTPNPGISASPQYFPAGGSPTDAHAAASRYHVDTGYQNLQTQQDATDQADATGAAQANSSVVYGPLAPILKIADEAQAKTQFNDRLSNEARQLSQGMTLRSAPALPAHNYLNFPHPALHSMVNTGADAGSVGQVGDTWIEIGNDLTGFQSDISAALARSETTWTGPAAEQARQSVAGLGNKVAGTGQAAQLTGIATHQQSQAVADARTHMPEVPAVSYNPQTSQQQAQTTTDPIAHALLPTQDAAAASTQTQAHQQAAHVVRTLDTTLAQSSATLPSYSPSAASKGASASAPVALPGVGTTSATHHYGSTTPRSTTGGGGGSSYAPGNAGTPSYPGQAMPGQPDPGQTGISGFDPTGGGEGNGWTGSPSTGPSGPSGGGTTGGGGGLGLVGFGGPGYGGGSGGNAGGSYGGGSSGGFGSGGSSAGSGGGRSGVGPGAAAAEEEAMSRGAAGARGTSGMSGMGAGARKGKGGEDTEHERPSYLIEPDPDSIFGADQMTIKPVIGE